MPTTKKPTAKRAGNTQRLDTTPSEPVLVKATIVKKKDEIAKATGRPTSYTPEIGDLICERITEGESLRSICKDEGMPSIATIFNWHRSIDGFLEQYTRAKDEQADTNAEDIQELVADVRKGRIDPQAARVAGDLLKWTASKLKPKKYGDKLDLTSDGKQMPAPIISIVGQNAIEENNS